MLQMMRYGGSDLTLSANSILGSSLQPENRCISKLVAQQSEASIEAMNEWEQSQILNNTVPFPLNRLMPPKAIINPASYEPFAELWDDKILEIDWKRDLVKYDAYILGYTYEITDITFNEADYQNQHGSDALSVQTITANNNTGYQDVYGVLGGDFKIYQKGWLQIYVKANTELTESANTRGGYTVDNTIGFIDYDGYNEGYDRSATVTFRATKQQPLPDGVTTVSEDKTHTTFQIIFYHKGNATPAATIWKEYDVAETSTLTLTHTADYPLDIAVTLPGVNTNSTYWDSTGWVHSPSVSSNLERAINISRSGNTSTIVINWNVIKQVAYSNNGVLETPIYIYGCWDNMQPSGTSDGHLIGNYNGSVVVNGNTNQPNSDLGSHTITGIKSTGNLNKTVDASTIEKHYTCMYKVHWKSTWTTFKVMPLESTDQAMLTQNQNIGGTYGLIYPVNGFERPSNQNVELRNYIGDSSVVNNNTSNITIFSTINESPASYIVTQYFPTGQDINETYTINGQSVGKTGSYTVNPSGNTSTLNINFGNIPAGSVRWLTLQQVDSREHANLSFTFNE